MLRDQRKQSAVVDIDGGAEPPQFPGQGESERVSQILEPRILPRAARPPRIDMSVGCAVLEAPIVEGGRADRRDEDHRSRARVIPTSEQTLAVWCGEIAEVAQDTAVLGESEPEREDHASVATLRHGFLEGEDGERLCGITADEVRHVGTPGEGGW